MSSLVRDPKLTYSESNYLMACATIIQRERPDYREDAVLTSARLKLLAVTGRHAQAHPDEVAAERAAIQIENELRGGDDE